MADGPSLQLTIDLCYTITPMKFHILKNVHIPMADRWQMADLCYTITTNKFHIEKNAHIPMAEDSPQSSIDPCNTIPPNEFHI